LTTSSRFLLEECLLFCRSASADPGFERSLDKLVGSRRAAAYWRDFFSLLTEHLDPLFRPSRTLFAFFRNFSQILSPAWQTFSHRGQAAGDGPVLDGSQRSFCNVPPLPCKRSPPSQLVPRFLVSSPATTGRGSPKKR